MAWWQTAVFYQIYPRSFLDTNGDGVGDLEGIRRRLDHLVWLGVDAIWISPFFRSPMKDYGYDVSDYCDVDPLFGTLADFDRLLAEAHARGLRVIIDWVPNHTSDQHPWFREARASRRSREARLVRLARRRPRSGRRTTGAPPSRSGPAWTWDEATGQWYLHLFLPEQPDLNWANPEVVAAMHDTLRFWLDRGVDGFRMDVIHCIGKDPALPDVPAERAIIPACALNDVESTHGAAARHPARARGLPRRARDGGRGRPAVDRDRRPLLRQRRRAAPRLQLPAALRALGGRAPGASRSSARRASSIRAAPGRPGCSRTTTTARHRTRYGSEARARAAAVLLLGLRGTPFLYAGEELGLEDAVVPAARVLDPGGRDGCRAPIPWERGRDPRLEHRRSLAAVAARRRAPQRRRAARRSRVDPAPLPAAARRAPRLARVARGLLRAARLARGRARVGTRPAAIAGSCW